MIGPMEDRLTFEAELWLWSGGSAAWHFVTLPEELSDEVAARSEGLASGFGSVRVRVRIGATEWATSLFPSTEAGAFVLPVKAAVRRAERLGAGDRVAVYLALVTE